MKRRMLISTIFFAIAGEIISDLYLIFTTGTEFLLPLLFRFLITVSLGWLIYNRRGWARWLLLIFVVNNIAFAGVTIWEDFLYLPIINTIILWILFVCELVASILLIFSRDVKLYINKSTGEQQTVSSN